MLIRIRRFHPGYALIFTLCMLVAGHAWAQTYTEGSIAGTVFDPSGAVVSNAAIVLHNDGTNAEMKLTSDGSGYFKAPQLPAAVYTVTVSAPGFAPFKEVNVIAQVGLTTEVVAHLNAAGETASVEVTGETPILNFESPDLSTILTASTIENLPLNGGRWSDMALFTPGTVGDANGFGLISFRGISPLLNNVEIDGADDNQAYYSEERGRTREGYSTSKYMIEEFQVNTGVYSAEFGRAAGGVINAISKSGSNTYHGMVYFSDRDNSWGAYNPFTTYTVNTSTTSIPNIVTSPAKPDDVRKEWGFDMGGPLKKDKLFWFYGYAQYQRNFPGDAKATTPGSFFALPDATLPTGYSCNPTDIYTGTTLTYGAGYIIPPTGGSAASSVDQMACELSVRVPSLGGTYAAGVAAYDTQMTNLLSDMGSVPRTGTEVLNTPKLDWQINGKNHLSALYHRLRWDSPGGVQTQSTNSYAIDTFGTDFVKLDYGLIKLNSEITNRLVNEVRFQYGRELNDEGQQPLSAYTKKYLQGTNGITNTAAYDFSPNVPEVSLDNPTTTGIYLGSPYYSYRRALPDEKKWQIGDTAAWQKVNHNIKFGLDMIHNYDIMNNTYEGNGVYTYSYIGNYFADLLNEGNATGVCNSSVTSPGSSAATDYTGKYPCGTFVQGFGTPAWNISTMDYGFFGEDHWKLTPRLTLDLGLRYDYENLPQPYSALVAASGSFAPYGPSTSGLCSAYTGPGTCPALAANANLANHPSNKLNFGPRIGFVYDPFGNGKTTLRLGYGLYFGRVTNGVLLNNLLNTGSPLGQYTSASLKPNNSAAPLFPNIISAAAGSTPSSQFFASNFKNPQVHEFDLAVQREVSPGTILQISYMGALSRELPNAVNINLNPNANTVSTAASPNGVIQSVITVSDASGQGPIPTGTTFIVPTYTGVLNPNFAAVNELFSNINASYNAMVAEIENKTSKRVQYDVSYTWSHALDFNQNESTTTLSSGWFDPYNIDGYKRGGNYGNSQFNVPNRVVAWAVLNSPEFKRNDWVKWVANDWSMNPVFQVQNGLPYSATIGSGYPSYSAYGSSWNGAGSNYWIPAIGHNTFQQRRTMVLDMRVEKQFPIMARGKSYNLQLLGEFFNLSNHQNVTGVSTTAYNLADNSGLTKTCAGTSTVAGQAQDECSTLSYVPKTGSGINASGFGAVTNANSNFAYSPRQVQISLRLEF